MVSPATQLCMSVAVAIDSTEVKGHGSVPIKLFRDTEI